MQQFRAYSKRADRHGYRRSLQTKCLHVEKEAFNDLDDREKLYACWMSKAAWLEMRITLQQVSPETNDIVNFFHRGA
ncbi:hypothetical protein VTN77DRAFT_267 [Rasamsonia byssochlamydoides]|uniref:uncharacterized protein n=1 Tax=Rasamsonia byssochlamydoides TaxID=89139 RepID=UPI00374448E7